MPEEVTAFDDPMNALLERRGRKRLKERPRKAQMDPGHVLVFPQGTRDSIHCPEEFFGLRLVGSEQIFQVAQRLMKVNRERMEDFPHKNWSTRLNRNSGIGSLSRCAHICLSQLLPAGRWRGEQEKQRGHSGQRQIYCLRLAIPTNRIGLHRLRVTLARAAVSLGVGIQDL